MGTTSRQSSGLDSRLLEIENLFLKREIRQALSRLQRLEREDFSPTGKDKGLYLLLLAQKAINKNDYRLTITLCQQALDEIETTSLNYRIGRLQLLLYRAYSALGDFKSAELAARDSLASYRRVKDEAGIADAYNGLGKIYYMQSV